MQLDLNNVRVTYSLKEVALVIGMLATLAGHVIRTEMQNTALDAQLTSVRKDVDNCKAQLSEELRRRAALDSSTAHR